MHSHLIEKIKSHIHNNLENRNERLLGIEYLLAYLHNVLYNSSYLETDKLFEINSQTKNYSKK